MEEFKILDVRWFKGVIGIVRVQTEDEGIKYFIGIGEGLTVEYDAEQIAYWGTTFPSNAGDSLFEITK